MQSSTVSLENMLVFDEGKQRLLYDLEVALMWNIAKEMNFCSHINSHNDIFIIMYAQTWR